MEDHHTTQSHRACHLTPFLILFSSLHSSVKKLLALIEDELDSPSRTSLSRLPSPVSLSSPSSTPSSDRSAFPRSRPSTSSRHVPPRQPSLDNYDSSDPPLTQAHSALRLRLLPLLSVETNLARQLLPEFGGASPPLPSASGWTKWASGASDDSANRFLFGNGELCVRAGGAWKSILQHVTGAPHNPSDASQDTPTNSPLAQPIVPASSSLSGKLSTRSTRPHPSDPTPLLEALAPDVHALWTDPAVRALLKRRGVLMEHSAGFFLNDVMRIGKPGWNPGIGSCPLPSSYPSLHTAPRRHCTR